MTKTNQTYKCLKCGNIAEILTSGTGNLVCCGQPMIFLSENTQEEVAVEKHVPVISRENNRIKVVVGEVEHPMTDDHWIEWVEIITPQKTYRHTFQPGEKPECLFEIPEETFKVRAYCNLHGLWKSEF